MKVGRSLASTVHLSQFPALLQPAQGFAHSTAVGEDCVAAFERIDRNTATGEFRNSGEQMVRQDANIRANSGYQVADDHSVENAKRVVGHNHKRARRGHAAKISIPDVVPNPDGA